MSYGAASAVLKRAIEVKLEARIPGALSPVPQQAPRLLPTGLPAVDRLLGGGVPLGGISEVAGTAGSGRTGLALAILAQATQEAACAYVDVGDSLDPVSAAAAGVRMENLLWVRLQTHVAPSSHVSSALPSELTTQDPALQAMLARKAEARRAKQEGTPGHPNQPLGLLAAPREQVAYERLFESGCYKGKPQEASAAPKPVPIRAMGPSAEKLWSLLDRAIRAADQILHSGGFRVVVLDLLSIAPEQARRIPAATWFRFRRAAEASDAVLLVLTEQPCAGSSAVCVLGCSPEAVSLESNLLRGMSRSVAVARQRFAGAGIKKIPGRAARWAAEPHWMHMPRAEA